MEINVKVTVDLGDKAISLISGALAANQSIDKVADMVSKVLEKYVDDPGEQPNETATVAPTEKPIRTRRTKEQIAAEAVAKTAPVKVEAPEPEEDAPDFAAMDDEEKVNTLRTKVSTYMRKGKSTDIRFMLTQFDARTVSQDEPLKSEDYDAFNEAIERYAAGESITDIFPELK